MPGKRTSRVNKKNEKQIAVWVPNEWFVRVWAYIDEHNEQIDWIDTMTMKSLVQHGINEYMYNHPNEH